VFCSEKYSVFIFYTKFNRRFSLNFFYSPFSNFELPTHAEQVGLNLFVASQLTEEKSNLLRRFSLIFPACSVFERKLSFFSFTGRLQETAKIIPSPGLAMAGWRVLREIMFMIYSIFNPGTKKQPPNFSSLRPLSDFAAVSPSFSSKNSSPHLFLFEHAAFTKSFSFFSTPIQTFGDNLFVSDSASMLSKPLVLLDKDYVSDYRL
jgi:hypothetical protein